MTVCLVFYSSHLGARIVVLICVSELINSIKYLMCLLPISCLLCEYVYIDPLLIKKMVVWGLERWLSS